MLAAAPVAPIPGTEIDWRARALELEREKEKAERERRRAPRRPETMPPPVPVGAYSSRPPADDYVAPALVGRQPGRASTGRQPIGVATPPELLVGRRDPLRMPADETEMKAVVVSVQAGHKQFVERACALTHLSQSDFYRRAALSSAEKILRERAPELEPYQTGPRPGRRRGR